MATIGELNDFGVVDLIDLLTRRKCSGRLAVKVAGQEVFLFFERGALCHVTSTDITLRLSRMLVRQSIIDTPQLALFFMEVDPALPETGSRSPEDCTPGRGRRGGGSEKETSDVTVPRCRRIARCPRPTATPNPKSLPLTRSTPSPRTPWRSTRLAERAPSSGMATFDGGRPPRAFEPGPRRSRAHSDAPLRRPSSNR